MRRLLSFAAGFTDASIPDQVTAVQDAVAADPAPEVVGPQCAE
jgi:hypothetical protein